MSSVRDPQCIPGVILWTSSVISHLCSTCFSLICLLVLCRYWLCYFSLNLPRRLTLFISAAAVDCTVHAWNKYVVWRFHFSVSIRKHLRIYWSNSKPIVTLVSTKGYYLTVVTDCLPLSVLERCSCYFYSIMCRFRNDLYFLSGCYIVLMHAPHISMSLSLQLISVFHCIDVCSSIIHIHEGCAPKAGIMRCIQKFSKSE